MTPRLRTQVSRKELYFACQHHVLELILDSAFKSSLSPPSSSPDVLFFKRFQSKWEDIDHGVIDTYSSDQRITTLFADNKDYILDFSVSQLAIHQPRDDYQELLELTIMFLGSKLPNGVHFWTPGPTHHVRWMSKAIYALKFWMFRKQLTWA